MSTLAVRASESEREATVEELRRHAAAGRLDVDELEQRAEAALSARTRQDLVDLQSDLPAQPPPSDFGQHVRVFAAVQLMLVAIWALTGAGYFWPVWPLMGWGIGLMLHGLCSPGRDRQWRPMTSKTRPIGSCPSSSRSSAWPSRASRSSSPSS